MKKIVLGIIVFVYGITPAYAFVNCVGTIDEVYLDKSGNLTISPSWNPGYKTVCNMLTVYKGVPLEICKGWLSITQTARISRVKTVVSYSQLDSCAQVGAYENADSPNYIMLYQ